MESTAPIQLLNKEQVCSELKVCKKTLEGMVNREEFPTGVRLGKRDMWSAQAVDKWIRRKVEHQESWGK